IGTLVARVSAQYRCVHSIECLNRVWTDLVGNHPLRRCWRCGLSAYDNIGQNEHTPITPPTPSSDCFRIFLHGFQIVSEKFYTVDDFNPHITKCNKMIIMATITKLRQCQSLDWQSITSWPTRLQGGWPGGTHGVIGDNPRLRPHGRGIWCVALWRPGISPL